MTICSTLLNGSGARICMQIVLNESCKSEGRTWIRICEQRAHRQQHFADGQSWAPLFLQDIQAYLAIAIDVTMINTSAEDHLQTVDRNKLDVRCSKGLEEAHALLNSCSLRPSVCKGLKCKGYSPDLKDCLLWCAPHNACKVTHNCCCISLANTALQLLNGKT